MHEAHFGLLVSTCIALFGSFISHATVCAERHACLSRGTCYSMSKKNWFDPSCSFRTTVTPAGFKLLNASVQFETMQLMNRGVCSPGSRQQVDSVTGVMICTRKRSWPDAFLAEIGDPTADTDHGRYCGRWIAAKNELAKRGKDRPLPKIFHSGGDSSMRRKWKNAMGKKGGPSADESRVLV